MLKAFDKRLREVRLRCSINLLIQWAGKILAAAGVVAVLIVLAEQLLAVELINRFSAWIFFGGAAFWILLLWLINQPSRLQVSLVLDERMRLRERFSTTLALADSEDPFAEAARREARQKAEQLRPAVHFPIRPSRCWIFAVSVWAMAVAFSFIPQKDLLGFSRKEDEDREQARKIEQAKAAIKEAATPVKLAVSRLGRPELAEALSKLEQIAKGAKPEDIKREAIKTLGDLADQIKKMQGSAELASLALMQKMLKQAPGSADMLSQQLLAALAKGNFAGASKALEQMRKQLEEGGLTDEQRKALAEQLQKLAKQIQELAQKNSELEKELEKLGLDKKLAKQSDKQLRESLAKQGLNQQQIEELLKKAAACRAACSLCSRLGDAMASCGAGGAGLLADDLAGLMDEIDQLGAMRDDLMAMQVSLSEIGRCMGCLGEGMCQGIGMGGLNEEYWNAHGGGIGGLQAGTETIDGPRAIAEIGPTSTKNTKVTSKVGEGPVIASWYFKGTQVKGEARRELSEVVQAGRDAAAEAINENEIPRKYQEAVKNYFSRLDEGAKE
ncbi:MAG: hypothetical protein JXN61_11845 [Sedimentisphaerales bacterium]|nr:hypothetical protein [Sedimentisphaerales bacterium]